MSEYKNIAVKPETHDRFRRFGNYGESADEVLNRLLDMAEKAKEFSEDVKENTGK